VAIFEDQKRRPINFLIGILLFLGMKKGRIASALLRCFNPWESSNKIKNKAYKKSNKASLVKPFLFN